MTERRPPTDIDFDDRWGESSPVPLAALWPAAEPSGAFVDRVLAARAAASTPRKHPLTRRHAGFALAAAALLAVGFGVGSRWGRRLDATHPTAAELSVDRRTTVDVGQRARVVLEPGAHLSYAVGPSGDARLRQRRGDAFYRVDRGGAFVVSTPAGDVRVKGTCFRVAQQAGAWLVTVLEGAVELENRQGRLTLDAGESGVIELGAPPRAASTVGEAPAVAPAGPSASDAMVPEAAFARRTGRGERMSATDTVSKSRALRRRPSEASALSATDDPLAPALARLGPGPTRTNVDEDPLIRLSRFEVGPAAADNIRWLDLIENATLRAYAQRLQSHVARHWDPAAALREELPEARGELGAGRTTRLRVRVGAGGALSSAEVDNTSGVIVLDAAAKSALERAQPLPPPPPELLDSFGELGLRFELHLDLSVSDFMTRISRVVSRRWRPDPTFQRFAPPDQVTVVLVQLSPAGVIVRATLERSAGVSHLDRSALATLSPGTALPGPPAHLGVPDQPLAVRVMFVPDVSGRGQVRAALAGHRAN